MIHFIALEYVNPYQNSDKFWHGAVFENGTLVVRWGRNDTQGQSKTHECGSVPSALARLDKLVGQKIGKGYQRVSTTAPQHDQQRTEIHAAQKSTTVVSLKLATDEFPKVSESTSDEVTRDRFEYIAWRE